MCDNKLRKLIEYNKMISTRLDDAFRTDPVWELALSLNEEGFDEDEVKCLLDKEKKKKICAIVSDVARLRLLNYMRDIIVMGVRRK